MDFDDSYQLKPGYTYTVTMQIRPTSEAEIAYAKEGSYSDTPSAGWDTGTHKDETGFYSNEKAVLTFEYTENEEATGLQTVEYPMPVVQVQKGYLTLTKKLAEGTTVDEGKTFEFVISIPADYAGIYNALFSTDTSGNGTQLEFAVAEGASYATATVQLAANEQVTIVLPDNITATISENEEAYAAEWTGDGEKQNDGMKVEIRQDDRADVTCTNKSLDWAFTVSKTVDGNMGDAAKDFQFTLTVTETDGSPLDEAIYQEIANSMSVTPQDEGESSEQEYSFNETGSVTFDLHGGQKMQSPIHRLFR